jgi:hypothetical protein
MLSIPHFEFIFVIINAAYSYSVDYVHLFSYQLAYYPFSCITYVIIIRCFNKGNSALGS